MNFDGSVQVSDEDDSSQENNEEYLSLLLEIKNSLELLDATPRRRAEVYQEITAMEHAAVAQLRKQEQK